MEYPRVDQAETIPRRIFHSIWERSKALTCNVCLKGFSKETVLDAHQRSHNLICCQRGRQFESVAAYEAHRALHKSDYWISVSNSGFELEPKPVMPEQAFKKLSIGVDEQRPPGDEAALLPPGRSMQAKVQHVDHHTMRNEVLSHLQYARPYTLEQYIAREYLVAESIPCESPLLLSPMKSDFSTRA